jgi:tetratricopeptide (TPR) repeat protein
LAEALGLLDRAQAAAERTGLDAERARVHHQRGRILFPLGRIEECAAEHERSLALARRSGSLEAEARALHGVALAAFARGRARTASGLFRRCLDLVREHGLGPVGVDAGSMFGFTRFYLNEPRGALETGLEEARAAARVGHQRTEMLAETLCVFACLETGAPELADERLGRQLRLARRLGARRFEAQGLELGGRVLLARGLRAAAAARLREALAMCREVGTQFTGPTTASALALAAEDPAERRAWLAEAEAMLARGARSPTTTSGCAGTRRR